MFNFLADIFGYILEYVYEFVNNYGIAIIIFSVIVKLLLLPLSIKQQKTMKKTAIIQEKTKEIQAKYGHNQEIMNKKIMELYKNEKMRPFSGCLSTIIQLLLLIGMFVLVKSPLTHMRNMDAKIAGKTELDIVKEYIQENSPESTISENYPEISIIKYVRQIKDNSIIEEKNEENIEEQLDENSEKEEIKVVENSEEISKEEVKELLDKSYINMDFLGLDLSNIPTENLKNFTVYIIPALYVISTFISMKITTKTTSVNTKKENEIKENGNENKENTEKSPEEMSAEMTKKMSWFMPVMSVSIALVAPLGLALYWLINNILMTVERVLLDKLFNSKEKEENLNG